MELGCHCRAYKHSGSHRGRRPSSPIFREHDVLLVVHHNLSSSGEAPINSSLMRVATKSWCWHRRRDPTRGSRATTLFTLLHEAFSLSGSRRSFVLERFTQPALSHHGFTGLGSAITDELVVDGLS